MSLGSLDPEQDTLIVISQKLSPNIICCLGDKKFMHLILVTSAHADEHTLNKKRRDFLEKVRENNGLFLNYPMEEPDNTLVRITGPLMGYYLISLMKQVIEQLNFSPKSITS